MEYCDRLLSGRIAQSIASRLQRQGKIVTDSRGRGVFVAVSMQDVTELNAYIRENEEQRMIAGLIYI